MQRKEVIRLKKQNKGIKEVEKTLGVNSFFLKKKFTGKLKNSKRPKKSTKDDPRIIFLGKNKIQPSQDHPG